MADTIFFGKRGEDVKELQIILNRHGASLLVDGIFGQGTERAVKAFQRKNNLVDDGIVGIRTIAKLYESSNEWQSGFIREPYPLEAKQYKQTETKKRGITIHYAVEPHNPYRVVDVWNKDSRGAVATHFVIGGKLGQANEHDGKVIQAFSLDYWAHHVAATRTGLPQRGRTEINEGYIGIECCTMGYLTIKNGKYYSESRRLYVPEDEVCVLDKSFRTFKYWHKMSDKMIASLEQLLKDLIKKERFLLDLDLHIDHAWFDLSWDALRSKRVLTTHTNFEHGKFDLMPQPELLEMLKRVYKWAGDNGFSK